MRTLRLAFSLSATRRAQYVSDWAILHAINRSLHFSPDNLTCSTGEGLRLALTFAVTVDDTEYAAVGTQRDAIRLAFIAIPFVQGYSCAYVTTVY